MAGTSTKTTICRKGYEDYTSLLPDCLIQHVFSFLPTRDVVKTCILSKRWRSVWTTVSDLRFSVSSYDDPFVHGVLTRYVRRKVKKFHHDIKEDSYHSIIDSWVHFVIDHQVEDLLNLNFLWRDIWWEGYTLSPLLNNCSSLTKLCLRGCCVSSRDSISWSSFKSLSIQNVSDDVLQKILMGSPVLEYLNLIRCQGVKGIRSRSLRELVIYSTIVESPSEISTTRLLSSRVKVDLFYEIIRIIEAPSLLEAELDFDSPAKSDCSLLKEMLCKLQSATQILFGAWCHRVMYVASEGRRSAGFAAELQVSDATHSLSPIQLSCYSKYASNCTKFGEAGHYFEPSDWRSLWYEFDSDSRDVDHKSYWHIEKKFKRWARQLKNVEIFGFYGCLRLKYEEVLMLVKFLLEHAYVLENMVTKVKNHNSQEDEDIEVVDSCKLLEVTQRLQKCHRASRHAAVILNCLEEAHGKGQKKGVKSNNNMFLHQA